MEILRSTWGSASTYRDEHELLGGAQLWACPLSVLLADAGYIEYYTGHIEYHTGYIEYHTGLINYHTGSIEYHTGHIEYHTLAT